MNNFDKASIAPIKPEVIAAMNEIYKGEYGNPSSLHRLGFNAKKRLEESREIIASTINAKPEQIIFTSGSTEAINWYVNYVQFVKRTGLEHHALLNNVRKSYGQILADNNNFYVIDKKGLRIATQDKENGRIVYNGHLFAEYINSEIGIINPIDKLSKCRKDKFCLFVDAAQAYGHIPIDVKKDDMDFMSTSAQKFGGPSGVGFLYVKNPDLKFHLSRGGSQEFNHRAGTENLAGIYGMATAALVAHQDMKEKRRKVTEIRNLLYGEITNKIPCAHLNGSADWRYRYEGNLNFRFDGYKGEEIQSFMNDFDVFVSTGSACASGSGEPSHVLKAIGLTDEEANSSIRFSFDSDNNIKEVDTVVKVLITALEALKYG